MQKRRRGFADQDFHRTGVDDKSPFAFFDLQSLDGRRLYIFILILQIVPLIFVQPGADQNPAYRTVFSIPSGSHFELCGQLCLLFRDQEQLLGVMDYVVRKRHAEGDRGVTELIVVRPVDDDRNALRQCRARPKLRCPARIRLQLKIQPALIQAKEAGRCPSKRLRCWYQWRPV